METFVVQIWVPTDEPSQGDVLRGIVRHVASGTETPFHDDEVLALLRVATRPPLTRPAKPKRGQPSPGSRE